MSFKRDSDDVNLFKDVQSRQISELFSNDIPEDEARLERNGRLLCLVCANKPLFDTINMLAVHRQGKKHVYWKEQFDVRKLELENLKQKRAHEQYNELGLLSCRNKNECTRNTKRHDLLKGTAYNPNSKKTGRKPKPYSRRQILDLCDVNPLDQLSNPISTSTSNDEGFHGSQHFSKQSCGSCRKNIDKYLHKSCSSCQSLGAATCQGEAKSERVRGSGAASSKNAQTVRDFVKLNNAQKSVELMFVRPYGSKTFMPRNQLVPSISKNQIRGNAVSVLESAPPVYTSVSLPSPTRSSAVLQDEDKGNDKNNIPTVPYSNCRTPCESFTSSCNVSLNSCVIQRNATCVTILNKNNYSGEPESVATHSANKTGENFNVADAVEARCQPDITSEKRAYMEKCLKAIESGWKRDRGGQWVRDPNVEFESDEEAPQI